VAVTIYVAGAVAVVGMPLMLPSLALRVSPAGSAGATLQFTTAPPLALGGVVCAGILAEKPYAGLSYAMEGAMSLTTIDMLAVALPPLFCAVTVNAVLAARAVGVPEMTPVVASMLRPAGSAGLTM
jgi:hypothetical protein